MPIQFDKFDQSKVDRLKNHLVSMAAKGQPKFYEIFVDSLKAVQKTDDPEEFEGYEDYMNHDSIQLKIVIYNTGNSPRNDQYVFMFQAKDRQDAMEIGLNGMPIKTFSYNDISEWRVKNTQKTFEQQEIGRLKKEIQELKSESNYKEEQIDALSKLVAEAKRNGNKIGGFDIGALLGSAVDTMIKKNPQVLQRLPFGNELAGLFQPEEPQPGSPNKEPAAEPTEATFKKKEATENQPPLTEDEQEFLKFFKVLRTHFTQDEFGKVISILDALSKDKNQLDPVVDLLDAGE